MKWTTLLICPICHKKTALGIQMGYLRKYPVRVHCMNCRTLMKGEFVLNDSKNDCGLHMVNASFEECLPELQTNNSDMTEINLPNVDYTTVLSGEIPCCYTEKYSGGLPLSPFISNVNTSGFAKYINSRLGRFNDDMDEWYANKSIALQLLDDGSIEYLPVALNNKLGNYTYKCDNWLKSLHCLEEVILEESEYLFIDPCQDNVLSILNHMIGATVGNHKDLLHGFISDIGGRDSLLNAYKKTISIFSHFMDIYSYVIPAEIYLVKKKYDKSDTKNKCMSTCSFIDIKSFYQDAYEALLSLMYIPVGLDNIEKRGNYKIFSASYDDVRCESGNRDLVWYLSLENGIRFNKLNNDEIYQYLVGMKADRHMRNSIGHNNYSYDGITQVITAYDRNKQYHKSLLGMAIECIGLAKSSVILSDLILALLREECREDGITALLHPRFYKGLERNMSCPCGSGKKFKKCCMPEYENLIHNNQ